MTLILPQLDLSKTKSSDREKKRLEELYSMDVLDASSNERFSDYTKLATTVVDAPFASVVLVDKDRLVYKAVYGRDISDVAREASFAEHTMREQELLIVPDAREDPRFASHPLVQGPPHVRSYAGSVIRGPGGQPLGALSVMDTCAHQYAEKERAFLVLLARILEHELVSCASVANLRRQLREHVLVDSATGLPTEALFTARLAGFLEDHPVETVLIALIRLERFESVHSAVGKPGAAHLVRTTVARIQDSMNREILMGQAREDVIALAIALQEDAAPEVEISKILDCFESPFLLGDHTLEQTVSIGTALYPDHGQESDVLLKRARTALNALPQSDVSAFQQYDRSLSDDAARHFEIRTALRGAIDRHELDVFYQPRFQIETGELVGAEALLRWTNESLGAVRPGEFIPIAESSGLIVQVGNWALATACRQIAEWRERGFDCPEVSVNVSSIQLKEPTFCSRVRALLKRHALDGSELNLEITESTLIESIGDAILIMTELREMGISLSIDDFGKGFSSLSYLARMPVQVLKIDQNFIDRIPKEVMSLTIVRSTIAMAHGLGLLVVAEGVETEAQLEALRKAGCDQVQGFLLGSPLEGREFVSAHLQGNSVSNARKKKDR